MNRAVTAFAALLATIALGAAPAANHSDPADLGALVGTWTCTSVNGNVVQHYKETAIKWGPWIQFTSDIPAIGDQPAHKTVDYFGYDPKGKVWINASVSSLGDYSVVKSTAPASASTSTWTDAYPVDPDDGPATVSFASKKYTVDATYKAKGKQTPFHVACTK
ncbi:MAG: hypothetical protein JOZ38_02035 [Candidatus Eremiobacteraeota bacterium]|nr:hypothetical protein [Candidatus Eremiobacteraeota bacterium]